MRGGKKRNHQHKIKVEHVAGKEKERYVEKNAPTEISHAYMRSSIRAISPTEWSV